MKRLRELQKPLKDAYRDEPAKARVTMSARSTPGEGGVPVSCSVDIGRAVYEAQAHAGVGGPGTAACSGDLLLGALAACKQVTLQMVAAALELPVTRVEVTVEGDLDLRGTLGIDKSGATPVGFSAIRETVRVEGALTDEQRTLLREKGEQYCVVLQTLRHPPRVESVWS